MQINMADYRGQMGAGQVNTAAFLAAIAGDDAGQQMRFPNLYIATDSSVAVSAARYFADGQSLTYTVQIADTSIATVAKAQGNSNNLIFTALQSGSTAATITASNGKSFDFTITVRRGANNNGWL